MKKTTSRSRQRALSSLVQGLSPATTPKMYACRTCLCRELGACTVCEPRRLQTHNQPVWQATKRSNKESYGVSLTALCCRREGSLCDEEEGAAVVSAQPPLPRRCCHRNAQSYTHSLSLSPSSIHTHAYTHVSTQGRRRWSWSKSTSL